MQCARGLEAVLADELKTLGARRVQPVAGGVLLDGEPPLAARANLWLRTGVRVLERVTDGRLERDTDLYELVRRAPWEELVGPDRTLAVRATLRGGPLRDSRWAALRVKDAICDRIRERRGRRPNVAPADPDVPLRLIVRDGEATLYRDWSGESLHRRGYRPIQVKSPLPEATAAGLLLLTGWDRRSPLLDPLCGSATFLVEAALLAAGRAPGLGRRFAAERFPDADAALWRTLRREAREPAARRPRDLLWGFDHHPGALAIADRSATAAGVRDAIHLGRADVGRLRPPVPPSLVLTNPPWGLRLGDDSTAIESWRALGALLRRCPGATAFVLSGDPALTRHLGLRSDQRWPIRVGPVDARLLRYPLLHRAERADIAAVGGEAVAAGKTDRAPQTDQDEERQEGPRTGDES